jgi:hypothetical protein
VVLAKLRAKMEVSKRRFNKMAKFAVAASLLGLAPAPALAQGLHVSNGKIYNANGVLWRGLGIGIADWDVFIHGAVLADHILALFPKMNLIRISCYTNPANSGSNWGAPASYFNFVNTMTKADVYVVFEDHNSQNAELTGAQLVAESNWYASLAGYYIYNTHVLFQTMNEPGVNDSSQMRATYDAIRGTGSKSLIFIEAGVGANGDPGSLGSQQVFNSMTNVVWDIHTYNWESGGSQDVPTIRKDQNSRIHSMRAVRSADGLMPVISLEGGNSTDGINVDPGGVQEIQATFTNPNFVGFAAWEWSQDGSLAADQSPADNLTFNYGAILSSYGHKVANYISSR